MLLFRCLGDLAHLASLNAGTAEASFAPIGPDAAAPPPRPALGCLIAMAQEVAGEGGDASSGTLPSCGAVAAQLARREPPAGDGGVEACGLGVSTVLVYFTRKSCPHCDTFTPALAKALDALQTSDSAAHAACRVVVVPMDGNAEGYAATAGAMAEAYGGAGAGPGSGGGGGVWGCVPPPSAAIGRELASCLGVRAVPTLTVLRFASAVSLSVVNLNAAGLVRAGAAFPWQAPPRLLNNTECKLIAFCSELCGLNAVKASEQGRLDLDRLGQAAAACAVLDSRVAALADGSGRASPRPPFIGASGSAPLVPHAFASLLVAGRADAFAGAAREVKSPDLPNFLAVPEQCRTTDECLAALAACEGVVNGLMRRCADGVVTSQLALKLQALALISHTFTLCLPSPVPLDLGPGALAACVWRGGVAAKGKACQLSTLGAVHGLMLSYGSLSQSVEAPTRASDAERALTAACMLAVFDAVLRVKPLCTLAPPEPPVAAAVAAAPAGPQCAPLFLELFGPLLEPCTGNGGVPAGSPAVSTADRLAG